MFSFAQLAGLEQTVACLQLHAVWDGPSLEEQVGAQQASELVYSLGEDEFMGRMKVCGEGCSRQMANTQGRSLAPCAPCCEAQYSHEAPSRAKDRTNQHDVSHKYGRVAFSASWVFGNRSRSSTFQGVPSSCRTSPLPCALSSIFCPFYGTC